MNAFVFHYLILIIFPLTQTVNALTNKLKNKMSEHKHDNNGVCHCKSSVAAQSLTEMDFDRGIWSAGNYLLSIYFIDIYEYPLGLTNSC